MLTRDEAIQLILYLVIATALLLASRVRADTFKFGASSSDLSCKVALCHGNDAAAASARPEEK
jgi:hypothetical protein